jgi:hypothetical protein
VAIASPPNKFQQRERSHRHWFLRKLHIQSDSRIDLPTVVDDDSRGVELGLKSRNHGMKKRSTAASLEQDPTEDPAQFVHDELEIYRRMRERFAQADKRLYELSEEFNTLGNLLRLRNASPETGLLPERLAVPMQAEVEAAVNEWCLARELTRRVWSELSKAAKLKYHETPIGEGTVH